MRRRNEKKKKRRKEMRCKINYINIVRRIEEE